MLAKGTRAGEYLLGGWVAEGATSELYTARHATEGTQVAVKVLGHGWCAHPEMVKRFLNEARTLLELRHPHLIQALAVGVLDGRPYMVLEWRPEDLYRALKRVGDRLPLRDSLQVIRQLAEVLALLHARGLIHRDIKLENVLVAQREAGDWRVQLADLGLAKRLLLERESASALPVSTAGSALLGTWAYMAPEQWVSSKSVDGRADVYSLGILGFRLLAGRLPFITEAQEGLMFCHVTREPPLELLEEVAPPELRSLLARMLAKKAMQRPSMKELLDALPPSSP